MLKYKMPKEAQARIKINKLLEEAGWRFFDSPDGKANIVLEPSVKITKTELGGLGDDFDKTKTGFIDFLLLDKQGFPFIVLEAKAENKNPLFGKEQARQYAQSQHCRFIILSNGNSHYFWDLERGNPQVIYRFPSPELAFGLSSFTPNREALANTSHANFLPYVYSSLRTNEVGERGVLQKNYFFPFLLLQSLHNICRFSGSVFPPSIHGFI
jgi:type I site-specific restriction endonuclease